MILKGRDFGKMANFAGVKRQLHIVALRMVRHNERHNILTAYSRELGRVAFAVPAGAGREAQRRRALLMPLSIVECVADIRPGREVHLMFDPRSELPLTGLRLNPVRSTVAMFISEVLGIVLREGPPDAALYGYVCRSVAELDALPLRNVANYHLYFLYGLGRFLGIEPDVSDYRDNMVFDMADGRFRLSAPLHGQFLDPVRSRAVVALSRMTPANLHMFRLSRRERNELLDGILRYYSLHYAALSGLRSLDVLRELF